MSLKSITCKDVFLSLLILTITLSGAALFYDNYKLAKNDECLASLKKQIDLYYESCDAKISESTISQNGAFSTTSSLSTEEKLKKILSQANSKKAREPKQNIKPMPCEPWTVAAPAQTPPSQTQAATVAAAKLKQLEELFKKEFKLSLSKDGIGNLKNAYTRLQSAKENLQVNYDALKIEFEGSKKERDEIKKANDALRKELSNAQKANDAMKGKYKDYDALKKKSEDYNNLKDQCDKARRLYTDVQSKYIKFCRTIHDIYLTKAGSRPKSATPEEQLEFIKAETRMKLRDMGYQIECRTAQGTTRVPLFHEEKFEVIVRDGKIVQLYEVKEVQFYVCEKKSTDGTMKVRTYPWAVEKEENVFVNIPDGVKFETIKKLQNSDWIEIKIPSGDIYFVKD